jgi:hypothetical protein
VQDFGEAVLDVVVAMAATSFCFMGVALKDDPHAHVQAQKPQPVVVRRVPAPQPVGPVMVNAERDCPEAQKA